MKLINFIFNRNDLVEDSLACFDLKISSSGVNHMYVGTGNGIVAHCSRHNLKLDPSCFTPEIGKLNIIKISKRISSILFISTKRHS